MPGLRRRLAGFPDARVDGQQMIDVHQFQHPLHQRAGRDHQPQPAVLYRGVVTQHLEPADARGITEGRG